MNVKIDNVKQTYTLRGSFPLPVGNLNKTESGFTYEGDGYKVETAVEKHGSGVYKRIDVITNVSDKPIDLRPRFAQRQTRAYQPYLPDARQQAEPDGDRRCR